MPLTNVGDGTSISSMVAVVVVVVVVIIAVGVGIPPVLEKVRTNGNEWTDDNNRADVVVVTTTARNRNFLFRYNGPFRK